MAKIAFDVKYRPQIESGEYKVETRDGRSVRIICWDRAPKDTQEEALSIVALVTEEGGEAVYYYRTNGQKWVPCHEFDLFIITPEPELTEFECGMLRYLRDGANCKDDAEIVKETKKHSEYQLRYARKQIEAEKKQSKRLPTIDEWEWIISNCEWKWDKERKGQVVTAKNGNSIFLPAAGYQCETSLDRVGSLGDYWSSSLGTGYPYDAPYVYFNSVGVLWGYDGRYYGQSVRPVSDTPQEGFVDMGNNLFWAVENEDGYYTYDEAMALFNDAR